MKLPVAIALSTLALLACGRGVATREVNPTVSGTVQTAGPTPSTSPTPATQAATPTPAASSTATPFPTPTTTPVPIQQVMRGDGRPTTASGRIVFASLGGGIYTVEPDGTGTALIAEPTGPPDRLGFRGAYAWPVWSPDGETILYSALLPDGRLGIDVSLRLAPVAGGQESLVFQDDPATSGIGSGVAHYAYWSPDSRRVALIAGTAAGLTGELVSVTSGDRQATLADGAPIYYSWSSDSRHILVHHGELLRLFEFDDRGSQIGLPREIGSGSLNYFAPSFSPAGDRILHADTKDGGTNVFSTRVDGSESTPMLQSSGRTAFAWAPDGRRVAVLSDESDGLFDRLTVLTAGGREMFRIARAALISFWWSPDATKLAVTAVARGPEGDPVIAVTVFDVRDQSEKQVATLVPSDEFLFMQVYFDQFAHSLRMWSPDSRYLVLFGAVGKPLAESASHSSQDMTERGAVWVVDATGALEPAVVGQGYIGSWSPR